MAVPADKWEGVHDGSQYGTSCIQHALMTDSIFGVILVHLILAVPYSTLMLTGSFSNFDVDWEAQARTLGASPFAAAECLRAVYGAD